MKTAPNARVLSPTASAVWLPIDELRPNPRNPRVHGAEVVRLARTILRTTWGAPIIAQASTRRIIGGHGRLEAARMILRGVEVDGILRGGADHLFAADAPGPGMVPVRLVEVGDAEADAMTLADNARAIQGTDDAAALVAMATASFERGAPTMEDIGLGAAELDALVKAAGDAVLAGSGAGVEGDDEEPEPTDHAADAAEADAAADSRPGEVYQLGPHRLVCGDSRDPAVWERLLGGEKPDALISDPPFGVSVVPRSGTIGGSVLAQNKVYRPVANDDVAFDPTPYVDAAPTVVLFGANYFARLLPRPGQWIVWDKCRPAGTTFSDCELAWTSREGVAVKKYSVTWNGMIREGESDPREHPTQKPVLLMRRIVEDFTEPGDIVLDPFGGSGSTMIGCAQAGRVARLIELDSRYCDVIRRRWTRFARSAGIDPGAGALDP